MRRTRASASTSKSSASKRTPLTKKPKPRRQRSLYGNKAKKRRRAGKDTPQAHLEQRCGEPGECVCCFKPAVLCSQCKLTNAVSSKYPAVPLPPLRHHPRGCLGFPSVFREYLVREVAHFNRSVDEVFKKRGLNSKLHSVWQRHSAVNSTMSPIKGRSGRKRKFAPEAEDGLHP